ncbi:hypothetical protein FRC14_005943 [Serendipita sp. 396]|nr:hypothetical protein FRC14_005943 [Serendipita sp. 396]KAG8825157.1 hypothetical protein FRC18_010374 [Serendipita sp. 400]KAG8864725.1 hypothetical protein FRC20_010106 [Serendipita sp. 405]
MQRVPPSVIVDVRTGRHRLRALAKSEALPISLLNRVQEYKSRPTLALFRHSIWHRNSQPLPPTFIPLTAHHQSRFIKTMQSRISCLISFLAVVTTFSQVVGAVPLSDHPSGHLCPAESRKGEELFDFVGVPADLCPNLAKWARGARKRMVLKKPVKSVQVGVIGETGRVAASAIYTDGTFSDPIFASINCIYKNPTSC